ncbi:MAG: sugar porter family MFS transporter [Ferruginibacter sp.]
MRGKKGQNRFLIVGIASVASIGGLLFGFDTGVISGALVFLQDNKGWALTDSQLGGVTTAVLLGAVVGSLVSGRITDIIGRKKIIIATAVIFMTGALLSGSATDVHYLIISRLFLGVGIGISSFSVPLYIAEISPARHRGSLVTINQLMITVGILISYLSDYWIANDDDPFSWRLMFYIGFIPGLMLFIGMFFLPETPRWLIRKGRYEEGKKVLSKIEDPDLIDISLNKLKDEMVADKGSGNISKQVFISLLKYPLIIGTGIMILSELTGIDTIIYYTPKIFKIAGYISNEQSLLPAIIVGASNVLFTIVSIFLIDKIGRRPLYFIGLFGLVVTLFLLGLCFYFQNELGYLFSSLTIITMFLFIGSFAVSFGPLSWLIISEIFPFKFRALGMSIGAFALWTSTTIVNYSFLKIVGILSLAGTFWAFAIMGIISGIWGFYFIPESKGKSLEYIEDQWRQGKLPREL